MHPDLVPLHQIDDLDRLLVAAGDNPVILFKHSQACGVSAEALDEVVEHLSRRRADVRYGIVTVQTHRALSNAIAKRFGVRHETPQVLLIRDGKVAWSATHFRVTAAAVTAALSTEAVVR